MLLMTRVFRGSLALILAAGAMAPAAANASPIGRLLHLHPRSAKTADARIIVLVYNRGVIPQEVKVGSGTYTVLPQKSITIKAPSGTEVYAASNGHGHRKGDLLFAVTPQLRGSTVSFN